MSGSARRIWERERRLVDERAAVYVYVRAYPPDAQRAPSRLVRQVGKADSRTGALQRVMLDQAARAIGRGKNDRNRGVHSYLLLRAPSFRCLSLGTPSGMTK